MLIAILITTLLRLFFYLNFVNIPFSSTVNLMILITLLITTAAIENIFLFWNNFLYFYYWLLFGFHINLFLCYHIWLVCSLWSNSKKVVKINFKDWNILVRLNFYFSFVILLIDSLLFLNLFLFFGHLLPVFLPDLTNTLRLKSFLTDPLLPLLELFLDFSLVFVNLLKILLLLYSFLTQRRRSNLLRSKAYFIVSYATINLIRL